MVRNFLSVSKKLEILKEAKTRGNLSAMEIHIMYNRVKFKIG